MAIGNFIKKYTPIGWQFSLWKNLFKGVSNFSLSNGVTSLLNKVTGASLTGAEQQANAFTAQQAQNQMDFQERMSNTAYQREVADMKAAGVNPALLYGSGSNGATTPSGASGASVSPSPGDFVGLLGQIANLSLLKAQKRLLDEQARKTSNEADKTAVDTKMVELTLEWYPKVQDAQIRRINSEVENAYKDLDVKDSLIAKQDAETSLADTKKAVEELNKEWIPRLNAARTGLDKANTIQAYAEAAYKRYCLDFAKSHDGLVPGYNQILGIGAAVSGTLENLGFGSKDLDDIGWYEAAFPFLSMITKRKNKN